MIIIALSAINNGPWVRSGKKRVCVMHGLNCTYFVLNSSLPQGPPGGNPPWHRRPPVPRLLWPPRQWLPLLSLQEEAHLHCLSCDLQLDLHHLSYTLCLDTNSHHLSLVQETPVFHHAWVYGARIQHNHAFLDCAVVATSFLCSQLNSRTMTSTLPSPEWL